MSHPLSVINEDNYASTLAHLIKDRRTVRKFLSEELSSPLLHELLHTATALTINTNAPPPFRVLLAVTAEEKKRATAIMMSTYSELAIYKWMPGKVRSFITDRMEQIPAIGVIVCNKGNNSEQYDQNFALTSAAIHNFSLLLWEQNVGMVWGTDDIFHNPSFRTGLQLQADEEVQAVIYIGHYAKKPKPKQRTDLAKKLTKLM